MESLQQRRAGGDVPTSMGAEAGGWKVGQYRTAGGSAGGALSSLSCASLPTDLFAFSLFRLMPGTLIDAR